MKTRSFVLVAFATGILCNQTFAQVDTSGRRNRDTTSRSDRDTSRNNRDSSWKKDRRDTLNKEAFIRVADKQATSAMVNNAVGDRDHSSYPGSPDSFMVTSRKLPGNYTKRQIAGDESLV
jgi:hypothetical protein